MTSRSSSVSSFWAGGPLPLHSKLCLKSFIDHGIGFSLYCYDDVDVPNGVDKRDARQILPSSRIFTYQKGPGAGSVAAFSNLFRYKLLLDHGGWWVDTDVLCLQAALPAEDVVFGWESDELIGNAVLKLPRNHGLANILYATAEAIIRNRGTELKWGEIGPNLLTRVATEAKALELARPSSDFYPIGYLEAKLSFLPDECERVQKSAERSLLFHLWNESLRRDSIDTVHAPVGSYFALALDRHGISEASASFDGTDRADHTS